MPLTITGVGRALRGIDNDFNEEVDRELRARALQAFAEIKAATPVDTGRARNSWHVGYTVSYTSNGAGSIQLQMLAPSSEPREINITNGTGYIEFLEMGSSIQAPMNFVRNIMNRYFDEVQIQVLPGERN